jgi:hypothetical protein
MKVIAKFEIPYMLSKGILELIFQIKTIIVKNYAKLVGSI